MSLQNRESLKDFFRKGNLPTERNFNDLIDSMINKVDDGMSKTAKEGLMLSLIGSSEKLMSFYKSIEDKNPAWSININRGDTNLHINNHLGDSILSLKHEGKVGVNNNNPLYEMDINGTMAAKGRIGSAYSGKVPGDGNWHPIVSELNGCHAFEIVAGIGKKKTGKYALIHANAISTYGKSKSKINITQAYYGMRGNKIMMRWTGDTYSYNLEIRTRINYGDNYFINYFISNLWLDTFMDDSYNEKA